MIERCLVLLCALLLFVKGCENKNITCFHTEGLNLTHCVVDANNSEHACHVYCERTGNVLSCSSQCIHTTLICSYVYDINNVINFCCNQPYCNIINDTNFTIMATTSTTPTPTTVNRSSDDDDDDNNNEYHIVIAVCVAVIVVLVAAIIGLAVFQWLQSRRRVINPPIPSNSRDSCDIADDSMKEILTSGRGSGLPRMVEHVHVNND